MAPAKTVADLQFAVATGRAIMIAASVTARVLPNDLLRPVEVSGLSPNVIAAARLRTDHRQVVRDFIDAAAETARDPDRSAPRRVPCRLITRR